MDEKSVGGLQLDIGNMYLLYLSRGTLNDEINTKVRKGKGSEICQQASGPNSVRQFFLFDYYDKLVCSRETEHLKLTETDFLGLRKIPAESSYRAISEQYLTLVDLEKAIEADNKNPFFYGDGKKPSDKPFLSMIQISLLPEIKQWKEKDLEAPITEGYVAKFLAECSEGIESIVSEYQESGLISKIFCSISACNLCVAIRSRQIDEVHEIAMEIRQMRLDSESSDFYQFPSMRCSTFTTMGIEEQASRDTSGYNLECVTDSLSKVVLRLALDDQGILNKDWKKTGLRVNSLSSSGNTGESGGATAHMEGVMGLYGRYDLSVQMGIGDFMRIFPILYNYKFIRKNMDVDLTKYTNDPVLLYVCNILRQKEAYVLNERILVSLKAGGAIENTNFDSRTVDKDLDLGLRETIQDQNCRIDYSLKALLDANALDDIFPRYLYRRHILILTDIWNEFKNLRFQADSFVNGYILYSHFDYLCRIIKGQLSALNDIAKKNDEELLDVAFKDFVENFRTLLRRIHDYYKLLQAVNYQSTQAPLLEMQMRTDLEKYVLAYTEFSQMLLKAIRDACNVDSASLQTINHIFTIDTMQSMIKAAPLFLLPYDSEGEKIYKARSDEKILLSVVVPGIDSFAHLYKILPPLLHELSHNYRVVCRADRNTILLDYVMGQCAAYIVEKWISLCNVGESYIALGLIQDKLLTAPVKKALIECYEETYERVKTNSNIGALLTNMKAFFVHRVFYNTDSMQTRNIQVPSGTQIDNTMKELLRYLSIDELTFTLEKEGKLSVPKLNDWFNRKKEHIYHNLSYTKTVIEILCVAHFEKIVTAVGDALKLIEDKQFCDLLKECILSIPAFEYSDSNDNAPEVKTRNEKIKEVCNSIFGDCSGFDEFSVNFHKDFIGIYGLLKDIDTQNAGCCNPDTWKYCNIMLRTIVREVEDFFQTMKDLNLLFNKIWCVAQDLDKEDSDIEKRNSFLLKIKENIQSALVSMQNSSVGDMDYFFKVLYGTKNVQKQLVPLSIAVEDDGIFQKQLKSVFYTISYKEVKCIMEDAVTLYRECFADLGMCAALELNCFGYLKVLASHTEEMGKNRAMLDRISYVELILLIEQLGDNQVLSKEALSGVQEKLASEILTYAEKLGVRYTYKNECSSVEKLERLISVLQSGEDWITDENPPNVEDILLSRKLEKSDRHRKLGWFLILGGEICKIELGQCDETLIEHFRTLYTKELKKVTVMSDGKEENPTIFAACCKRVGEAFNQYTLQIGVRTEYFKDTVSFVMYYYYHNLFSSSRNMYQYEKERKSGHENDN